MPTSLAQLLTETASRFAERPALKLDDSVVNYAVLNEGATRIAGLLKDKGLEPGDRVGIMLPNVPYFAVVYYGILRAGGVVVPMNPLLKGREVAYYLNDPGAKILFAWHGFEEPATTGAESRCPSRSSSCSPCSAMGECLQMRGQRTYTHPVLAVICG